MQRSRGYLMRSTVAAAALAAGAVLAGCGDDDGSDPAPRTPDLPTITMTTQGATTSPGGDEDTVTPQAAQQLCDMIEPELDNWRDQGSTVAKVSFNGTVQNWAARNEGLNDEVIRDNSIVDTVTTQTCPDVRQQAIDILEVPDLASALAGWDN